MKINQIFGIASFVLAVLSSGLMAQNFQTMPVSSGYNADVIANGVGPSTVSTSIDVDGVDFAFVATDFQLTSSSTPITYGIPVNGIINSVVAGTPGLSYQLSSLSANNSLRLTTIGQSGTMVFSSPKAALRLYMLSTSGSGTSNVDITVTFSDNTTQIFTNLELSDWYNGSNFAIQGIGRVTRSTGVLEANSTNPRLYQGVLNIDAANQAKPIQSVTVTKVGTSTGISNIFAFSADVYSDCAPPVVQPATNITSTGATVSWTASSSAQASSYSVYYSTSSSIPTSGAVPQVANVSGTSTPLGILTPNTTYYYWVRTNCANTTGQSAWSFSGTFKTLCGPVTSLSENFDSYAAAAVLPDCWVRLVTTGTLSINSTTPASGLRNIYQYSSTSQAATTAVLPEFSNINAGTHWLKFKARVSSGAPGTLNVGYLTNPTDASTFVLIQALSITNISYGPDYTVIVPSSVPATARLAIRNAADAKGYYYDDVIWEPIPTCVAPTGVVTSNPTVNSVNVAFTPPFSGASNGYEYYYSPVSTVVPTATTNASGTFPANSTSGTITGLNPSQTYNLWVRSVCSAADKSSWTYQTFFRTACAPAATLFEDFESYATGSIVPDCWARIVPNGSQTISLTSPASGVRNIYQYTVAANTPSVVVLPELSNINADTHRLRFKARVTSATGTLNVGYVTNVSDASTFVNIETLSIANTTYTSGAEYIVNVPSTVPANARLAIKNTNDGKSYYWDDIVWENKNALSTVETPAKKKLTIHPNPFNDVIYISETKDIKSVMIYDLAGRVVKLVNDASKEIQVGDLKEGMYLVKVNFKDGSQSVTKAIKR